VEELELFSYPGFCARLGWGVWGCEAVVALAGRSLKKKMRKRADYQIQQGGEPRVVQDLRPEALNAVYG
jgi:hypothetical protein